MRSLAGRHVFLSAGFPSGDRGEAVRPFDASAIADAVTAVVRSVLSVDGKLLFGGHTTITPLVLMIAMEHHARDSVDVFQSRWFDDKITPETRRLADSGLGTIHLTPKCDDMADSLLTMRMWMFRFDRPVGAVFVGGMDGIVEEHELVGKMLPGIPRIPIKGPGGAAARLPVDGEVPRSLARRLGSRSYPLVASEIVDFLSTQPPIS